MTRNLSYQNDPALKPRLLGHIEAHRKADSIARGTYGTTDGSGHWRGCAVGCSIRSLDEIDGKPRRSDSRYNAHQELADRVLGGHVQLAYLEDHLFERMGAADAMLWPGLFAAAIPVGADLSLVYPRFQHWLLVDPTNGVLQYASTDQTKAAIRGVADLFAEQIAGGEISAARWQSAARWSAAAAAAARWSADAAAAAAARWSAAAAAADAARSRHYKVMAEALLRFLSEAPVVG